MSIQTLAVGEAGRRDDGVTTINIEEKLNPDVVHDLNQTPYPFDDNQFDRISCHHVIEHLDNIDGVMAELHRICKPDGEVYIEVPYHSCWQAKSPHHKYMFCYYSFDCFTDKAGAEWVPCPQFRYKKRLITFHKRWTWCGLHLLFNKFPKYYELFYPYIFPAEHFKVWLQPIK